jgi:hypothetical protein
MSKAKPITRVHTVSEQDSCAPVSGTHRYTRANSPRQVHGERGTKSENVRGRFSEPDPKEVEDMKNDPELRARTFGRRSKHTSRVAGLKKV